MSVDPNLVDYLMRYDALPESVKHPEVEEQDAKQYSKENAMQASVQAEYYKTYNKRRKEQERQVESYAVLIDLNEAIIRSGRPDLGSEALSNNLYRIQCFLTKYPVALFLQRDQYNETPYTYAIKHGSKLAQKLIKGKLRQGLSGRAYA